jgi:hypothetical protein
MDLLSYITSLALFLLATLLVAGCSYLVLHQLAGRREAAPRPVRNDDQFPLP